MRSRTQPRTLPACLDHFNVPLDDILWIEESAVLRTKIFRERLAPAHDCGLHVRRLKAVSK